MCRGFYCDETAALAASEALDKRGYKSQLAVTDGSVAGTRFVTAVSGGLYPSDLVAADGGVYFVGVDGSFEAQVFFSDGTAAGSAVLASSTAVGTNLYFTGLNGSAGYQVWSTDGTAPGTKVLSNFPSGLSTIPAYLTPFGNALLFLEPPSQLWTYRP